MNLRVHVAGELGHLSGYLQNHSLRTDLVFQRSTSRRVRLAPGSYSLTVFVGAGTGGTDVDFTVELITEPSVHIHLPRGNPIRASTVGAIGFVVIDFTLS